MKQYQKLCTKKGMVTDIGKRSKTLNEVNLIPKHKLESSKLSWHKSSAKESPYFT